MSTDYASFLEGLISGSARHIRDLGLIWVTAGALIGGCASALLKISEISDEPKTVYKNKTVEIPIRFTYQVSRVASHAGFGAAIGGFTAATAPVTIPFYIWWRSDIAPSNKK